MMEYDAERHVLAVHDDEAFPFGSRQRISDKANR
jgi:hypothetical protein